MIHVHTCNMTAKIIQMISFIEGSLISINAVLCEGKHRDLLFGQLIVQIQIKDLQEIVSWS